MELVRRWGPQAFPIVVWALSAATFAALCAGPRQAAPRLRAEETIEVVARRHSPRTGSPALTAAHVAAGG